MNNKGFALSGILYSILALFLMLLLLILGNFQSRKVTFDKQKNNVLQKLEGKNASTQVKEFCYSSDIQRFETPQDGTYLIEIYSSNNGTYLSGKIKLYQGISLYVLVGKDNNSISSVRTEENRASTVIMRYISPEDTYIYSSDKGKNDDIALDYVTESVIANTTQNNCNDSALIRISNISE